MNAQPAPAESGRGARRINHRRLSLKSGAMHFSRFRMLSLLVAGALASGLIVSSMFAATSDEKAVLVPIQAMFDGMAKRDAAEIKASALAGATMVLMHDGKTEQITFEAFGERVGKGKTQIEERIHDPLMRLDSDLAVGWAPFEFRLNGKVDHCGTDLFNLVRTDGRWLIANFVAAVRKGCGAEEWLAAGRLELQNRRCSNCSAGSGL